LVTVAVHEIGVVSPSGKAVLSAGSVIAIAGSGGGDAGGTVGPGGVPAKQFGVRLLPIATRI
jgi:hypothetical protein